MYRLADRVGGSAKSSNCNPADLPFDGPDQTSTRKASKLARMAAQPPSKRADAVRASLLALIEAVAREEDSQRASIAAALPKHRSSAINLAHYLGLRKQDVHTLQLELAALGLSSLGRCEGHVRDTLLRLTAWLSGDRDQAMAPDPGQDLDWAKAETILHANTHALFGPPPSARHVYIMVTAPDATEVTAGWADDLLQAGVDLLRINSAHEAPQEWAAIASTFKARAAARAKPGRVVVDLPGPKLRTEIHQLEEGVLHLPRRKDRLGALWRPRRCFSSRSTRQARRYPCPPIGWPGFGPLMWSP